MEKCFYAHTALKGTIILTSLQLHYDICFIPVSAYVSNREIFQSYIMYEFI